MGKVPTEKYATSCLLSINPRPKPGLGSLFRRQLEHSTDGKGDTEVAVVENSNCAGGGCGSRGHSRPQAEAP